MSRIETVSHSLTEFQTLTSRWECYGLSIRSGRPAGGEHSDIQRMLIAMLPIIFLSTILSKFEVLTVQKSCQFDEVTKYNLQ